MNLQTLAAFSPSEGGHGLADEERVNGVLIAGTVYRNSCQGRQAMNLQTLAAFSPSEGGHGLADEERVNGVLIAGTVYRNSCQEGQWCADSWHGLP
jgi:hypothetical protein